MKKSNKVLLSVLGGSLILTTAVLTNISTFADTEDGGLSGWFHGEEGNGKLVTQNFPVENFNRIHIRGKADVTIQPGKFNNVSIMTDENILPHLKVENENGQLFVGGKSQASLAPTEEKIVITSNNEINEVTLGGKINLNAENLQSNDLDLSTGGKSEITLTGNIKNLQITTGGKSDINAKILHGESFRLIMGGKSFANLAGDVDSLSISSGGKTNIDAQKLIANDVDINSTGKSDLSVYAKKTLNANVAGESHIRYLGNPRINKNSVGLVSIEKIND